MSHPLHVVEGTTLEAIGDSWVLAIDLSTDQDQQLNR
jgi:hypothetical protein